MAISDWPEATRPREKLLARGAESLADAELLAIFLRTGVVGKSAVDLAHELLSRFGGLAPLSRASREAVCAAPGLGLAKYAQLQAVMEMARRAIGETLRVGDAMQNPDAVRDYLRMLLGGRDHEVFCVVFLDAQNRVIATEELFRGSLTQTQVYPREVARRALAHNAAAVILAHNHPSGVAEPSQADCQLTRHLGSALALLDVKVLDHFIVAGAACLSFAERGLM
jgi:DNA repair protein RadC